MNDQLMILQMVNRFGVSIDLKKWADVQPLFADQVNYDYSAMGEPPVIFTPVQIVQKLEQTFSGFKATQHSLVNHIIEVNGSEAHSHVHVRAMHYLPQLLGEDYYENGGYYTIKLNKINSTDWRITSWQFTLIWERGDRSLFKKAS